MSKYVLLSKNMDGSENEIYEEVNENICIEAESPSHARQLYVDFRFEFSSRYEVKAVIFEQFIDCYKNDDLEELNDFDTESDLMTRIIKYTANEDDDYEEERKLTNDLFDQLSQEDAKMLYFDACEEEYRVVEVVDFEDYMEREIANLSSLIQGITINEILTYNIVSNMIRNGYNEYKITTAELSEYGLNNDEIGAYITYMSSGQLKSVISIQYDNGNYKYLNICSQVEVQGGNDERFFLKITPSRELIDLAMSGYNFREGKTIEAIKVLEQCDSN